ncbi:MAG: DsbA family protein [Rickettsiales bacterium]|nr:DsbA family protein [Rickettsiales bacterium]
MAKNRTPFITTIIVAVIASALTIAGADHFKLTQKTQTDDARVKELVHEYLNENPKAIIEALQGWKIREEARLAQEQQNAVKKHMPNFEPGELFPMAGNPDGDVTVVEFFDYNCPACKAMYESLNTTIKKDPNVRVLFAEFPIFGPTSITNAKIGLAVSKLDSSKYIKFHESMMRAKGKINEEYATNVAVNLGIDANKLKEEIAKPEYDDKLNKIRAMAKDMQIRGTPAVVIGDVLFNGVVDFPDMQSHIAWARKKMENGDMPTGEESSDDEDDDDEDEEEGEE